MMFGIVLLVQKLLFEIPQEIKKYNSMEVSFLQRG
jgi:hypothetical protein